LRVVLKFVDSDGNIKLDIDDEIKEEEVYTWIPEFVAKISMAIGENVIPYMVQALALVQLADLIGYPPSAPVAQSVEAADLKSV
jgi:hypothetical protein